MATEHGFIYFLGNQCMPGIFKIGFTTNHPKVRIEQLSGATACPTPFEMVACFGVKDPREVETSIHRQLDHCRLNRSREFFMISPSALQDIVSEWGDPYFDLVNTFNLDMLANSQKETDDHNWKINHFQDQCADPIFWPSANPFKGLS